MRLLIQRVKHASVAIGGDVRSRIEAGLLVLLGVGCDDTDEDIEYLAGKLVRLRIFDDEAGVMNLDVCLLYTSPSPGDKRQSRMPSSA